MQDAPEGLALPREQAIQPLTIRIKDACRLTGIGRSKLYSLIKEGRIEVIKVGSITLIPMRSLRSFLSLETA